MKQYVFMVALTLLGTVGVVVSPFLGVAVYYLFAVLRPQALWQWSLPPGITWSYYVAIATMIAALCSLAGFRNASRHSQRRLTLAQGAFAAFGLWVGISYLMARDQFVAYPWFLEYAKIFVMCAVSAVLILNVRQLWILLTISALSLGYIACDINILYFSQGYLGICLNGYGGLDNNGTGLMLAMGVPLCLFAWEGTTHWWRWAYLGLVPVLLHAVLMTYSRGAMVSLLVTAPLIVLRSRHRTRIVWAGLALLVMLPFLAGPEIRARFFTVSKYEEDGSAQSRFQSWNAAWHIARDNPIFGVGVRNANLFSHQYGADEEGRTIHNQYLQTAADTGFVGLTLYMAGLAGVWLSLKRTRRVAAARQGPDGDRLHALAAGIECSLAVFCVGGMFLSLDVFELPYLLLLLGAQIAPLCEACPDTLAMRIAPRRGSGLLRATA
ncbi:MAG: O-antigen ligase family protein [Gemmataceae bacterium]|nr:O-antigen ligase family protein [Gemmataceae bacterium]